MLLLEGLVILNDLNRGAKNRDVLKRLNYPRQTYAFSGVDWGEAATPARVRSKLNITDAPMIITPMPPGANATSNTNWKQTYGASMDCVMSLIDGDAYSSNALAALTAFPSIYADSMPTANNSNLYEVYNEQQQIQFVAGKDDVKEFREGAATPLNIFEVRSLGMRAPMQMCGWGHTVGMRPTDPEPADKRRNDREHKYDRSSWKVGPLDARWDNKRRVWRAFNDLIVDNNKKDLGTLVFGTNPDVACGFPFLRGKLEDVWEVRRTYREIGTEGAAKNNDTTKSALLTTKLDGYALLEDKIGQWSDVLVLHNNCWSGFEASCGTEKTTEAQMAISTAADFYANKLAAGPIAFSIGPAPDGVELGNMYYVGDGACGEWQPGIEIDICKVGENQFAATYSNDQALATAVISLCAMMGGSEATRMQEGETMLDRVNQNRDWLDRDVNLDIEHAGLTQSLTEVNSSAYVSISAWTEEILGVINTQLEASLMSAIGGSNMALKSAMETLQSAMTAGIQGLADHIVSELSANCDCAISPFNFDPAPIIIGPAQFIPPNIWPPWDSDPFENSLTAISDSIDKPLLDDLGELQSEIQHANDTDETNEEDPAPGISVLLNDPCGGGGTYSC